MLRHSLHPPSHEQTLCSIDYVPYKKKNLPWEDPILSSLSLKQQTRVKITGALQDFTTLLESPTHVNPSWGYLTPRITHLNCTNYPKSTRHIAFSIFVLES